MVQWNTLFTSRATQPKGDFLPLGLSFVGAVLLLVILMIAVLPLFLVVQGVVCLVWLAFVLWKKQNVALRHASLQVGRAARTGRVASWLKYVLFVTGLVYIVLFTAPYNQLQASVAFVFLCFLAKLFELHHKRDRMVAIFFGLFTLSLVFLFDQTLFKTVWVVVGICFWFLALKDEATLVDWSQTIPNVWLTHVAPLNGLQQNNSPQLSMKAQSVRLWQDIKALAGMLCITLPLVGVLYVFFPRMDPLWHVPLGGEKTAKTGVTDTLRMGDISALSQSFEPAFTVRFKQVKDVPAPAQRYFRAVVLGQFDGSRWTRLPTPEYDLSVPIITQKLAQLPPHAAVEYSVTQEANAQPWIFSLQGSVSKDDHVYISSEYTLRYKDPLLESQQFQLIQMPQWVFDRRLPKNAPFLKQYTQLPKQLNPRSVVFAQQLWKQSHQQTTYFINALRQHIYQHNFRYTLTPPALTSANKVDSFWFDTQAGFCEHYASSTAFMLRSVGIPARVVGGYLGGVLQADGVSLVVKQMDAHAWVEYWQPQMGWLRFDPTAAVSPLRVEQGMDALANQPEIFGTGLTGQLSYRRFQWLKQMNVWADQADLFWQQQVVGYQRKQQYQLLRLLGLDVAWNQLISVLAVLALLSVGFYGWLRYSSQPKYSAIFKLLVRLEKEATRCCHKMGRASSTLPIAQGIDQWTQEMTLLFHDHPPILQQLNRMRHSFYAMVYMPNESSDLKNNLLQQAFKQEVLALVRLFRHCLL